MTQKIICLVTTGIIICSSITNGVTASRVAIASLTNHAAGHIHRHNEGLKGAAPEESVEDPTSMKITTYHHHASGGPEHQHARIPFAVTVMMDSSCSTLPTPTRIHFVSHESIAAFSECAQPLSLSFELILRPPIS